MENISYVSVSQQTALAKQMEAIANNIANISTPGFKQQNMAFKEYIAKNEDGQATSYVVENGAITDFNQGAMTTTGADFDFAINGEGFFSIGGQAGTQYTRDGHFRLDANGQIVSSNGDPLLSDSGSPLVVPSAAEKITLTKNGVLYADKTVIGRVGLVKFKNPNSLIRETAGLYKVQPNSLDQPQPVTKPQIYQGMLESSNVQGIVEITRMMQVSRSYESAQKLIDTDDNRLRDTIKRLSQS